MDDVAGALVSSVVRRSVLGFVGFVASLCAFLFAFNLELGAILSIMEELQVRNGTVFGMQNGTLIIDKAKRAVLICCRYFIPGAHTLIRCYLSSRFGTIPKLGPTPLDI
jgi:hypothetical protein